MPPFTGVAVKVAACPAQIEVLLADTVTDGATEPVTVIVTGADVAVVAERQVALLVSMHVTCALLVSVVVVKVALFVPAFIPFTCHWYAGVVPPFTGVAVKVTDVPLQIVVAEALIVTDGVAPGLTVILMALDDAVAGLAQADDEVSWQVTTSLLLSVAEVKVALLLPTLLPFTFH